MILEAIEVSDKKLVLTVGEVKHMAYTLSYMTRNVKKGFKKTAESKSDFKEKMNMYTEMRNDIIDQVTEFKDEDDNKVIEIVVKSEHSDMLNEFVRQQIQLFNDMLKDAQDDLNKNIHAHIVPLQTIAFKLSY